MQMLDTALENYYKGLNSHSRESKELPCVVNCAGKLCINRAFLTYNAVGREDYYLLYVTEGKLNVKLDGNVTTMVAGDFVIFPPNYKYWYEHEGKDTISYFYVHFTGSHIKDYLERLGMSVNPTVRRARLGEEFSLALTSFFIECESTALFKDMSTSVEFSRILLLLAKANRFGDTHHAIAKSLAYISENYTESIDVPVLAAMDGLSVSRYNYLFREAMGISPIKYVTNLRMRQARILLESTDIAVKQIAKTVGYDDNHFFSKIFKAYVGVSPAAYRKGESQS